jgi:hypothetical protein
LQEFPTRLGPRWLGETRVAISSKRSCTPIPDSSKQFVLVALLSIVAAIAAAGLFGFLSPILNFMSIQKMLLDLQEGNFVSLGYRIASYIALFFMGYSLHRVIRAKLDAMKLKPFLKPAFRIPLSNHCLSPR